MNFLSSALIFSLAVLLPAVVSGDCTCDLEGDQASGGSKGITRKYKIAALAAIIAAGAAGVCLPMVGKTVDALSSEKSFFFVLKAFAASVILSTGFIHVLPDAFESLTSSCLGDRPWDKLPFMGFVAMVAAIETLVVDTYAMSYFRRLEAEKRAEGAELLPVHTHGDHGHVHGTVSGELLRHRVRARYRSSLGNNQDSLLGASHSPNTIRPIGLGGCITQAKFNSQAVAILEIVQN
ncbi:zinc/iron transporter [Striga asiatica]|uniref:Zinc/iron transporter n=1 Tax=Striga asiatica TaxID=4170 RepID=A0A5A7QR21_STRAF|nr:zinc/iron transporter [Striga asiatica]